MRNGGSGIIIKYPDGKEVSGTLSEIEGKLKKAKAVAVRVNGGLQDLSQLGHLGDEVSLETVTFDSPEGKEIYRHSTSHIMAHAVKTLFPKAKLAIGPATVEGFYYDFDLDRPLTPEDIEHIEKKMGEIINENRPFNRRVISKTEAERFFKDAGEEYKVELLKEITDESVSVYEEGGFMDLCRGPHVPSTGTVRAFKLLSIAGAYWRGDEKNKMLQRIYGTAFDREKDLKEYLSFLEEVKKRDHRKLGRELDLFSINDEIGAGLILWHPNGALIRKTIEDFWRNEHLKADYSLLYTPHIAKLDLWNRSGHLDFYRENMYSPMEIEGVDYEIKPMNCPFHISIYKSSLKSYRELPVRYAELGTVYRYERSGTLHGLLRVRGFTQDDAHIFCREDQIEDEILNILDFTLFILKTFGFDSYDVYLSTRPEGYVGNLENWDRATNALIQAMEKKGLTYEIDPGAGVFYGPKIDIKVKDSLGRAWQCSTIQVDFNNPERFDVGFRGSDGKEHRPIMIHRALMGSLERFFGILVEHYAGAFPVWLSPVQVAVLTIAERHANHASAVAERLKSEGIRTVLNIDNEKIGHKIREATIRKIPYLGIIGDREVAETRISVRKRSGEDLGAMTEDALMTRLKEDITRRR
ncbi:MAG TPA: threonine--tRNA ligase [Thermodesulfovibrionales bacterium]|nr:threonine--tRNA ligase [Thermodesulfovibrionales bacterium]